MLKQDQFLHQSTENKDSHLFEIQVVFIFVHTEIFAFQETQIFNKMSDTILCAKLSQN